MKRRSLLDALVCELDDNNVVLFDLYKKSKLDTNKFLSECKKIADDTSSDLQPIAYGKLINFCLYLNKQLDTAEELRKII